MLNLSVTGFNRRRREEAIKAEKEAKKKAKKKAKKSPKKEG